MQGCQRSDIVIDCTMPTSNWPAKSEVATKKDNFPHHTDPADPGPPTKQHSESPWKLPHVWKSSRQLHEFSTSLRRRASSSTVIRASCLDLRSRRTKSQYVCLSATRVQDRAFVPSRRGDHLGRCSKLAFSFTRHDSHFLREP